MFMWTSAMFSFYNLSPQLFTARRISYTPSFSKVFPINFNVLNLQPIFANIY